MFLSKWISQPVCPKPYGLSDRINAGSYPIFVVSNDLNNDTKLDLVVANFQQRDISVLLDDGHGAFHHQTKYTVGNETFQKQIVATQWQDWYSFELMFMIDFM